MRRLRFARVIAASLVCGLFVAWSLPGAGAQTKYQRISGEGSTWAKNAIDEMKSNVAQFGITVDYSGTGSSSGRANFIRGVVDFAASDIPFQFQPEDGSEPEKAVRGSYAYIPVTAGGTAFMYNLKVNGQRVTNLRLSGQNVAKLFTGAITSWNDPALQEDNPGLTLPDRRVVPVVRSDGSGSTAQFTRWLIHRHGGIWDDYCQRSGRAPACGQTSIYPTIAGMIAQQGDPGVAGYVSQGYGEGAIGYVNYSYALEALFPVARVLNAAGYYTEPTPENVAVSLLKAGINRDESSDDYLTQELDGVYTDPDPRNYQLSSYSYLILPTKLPEPGKGNFNIVKGRTLADFSYYAMCQAQERSASLGYSPMPINLVEASFEQIRKIPGVEVQDIEVSGCRNPTFSPDGTNLLAQSAPMPQECDRKGSSQCATGTGGVKTVSTPVNSAAAAQAPAAGDAAAGTAGQGSSGGTSGEGSTGGTADGGPSAAAGVDVTGSPLACDPDTGACGTGAGSGSGQAAGRALGNGAGERAIASPTVLAGSGWSASKGLIVLVMLLTLALVFAPAAAWRHFSNGARA